MKEPKQYDIGERVRATRDRITFFNARVVGKGANQEKGVTGYEIEFDHGARMTVAYPVAHLYLQDLP